MTEKKYCYRHEDGNDSEGLPVAPTRGEAE